MRAPVTRPATGAAQSRLRPLDGVRAVAIFVVMAYHSGIPGAQVGGFYGQDAFFVLSGLLITALLLREGETRRGIGLVAFWGRRARRLLPALVVLLLVVDLYVSYVAPAGRYTGFPGDAVSALFYFSNWHLVAETSNYFAASGSPSLLTHTWSLAIEEQYYLVWPLVVLAALRVNRGRIRRAVWSVLAIAAVGTAASASWMAHLYAEGVDPSRLYYGTDTHCQCLLVGAALAAALWLWRERTGQTGLLPEASSSLLRALLSVGGLLGVAGLCYLWTQVSSSDPFAYEGGFLAIAACTAAVLASVTGVPRGPLARLLGCRPLAFVGLISYGMYLWYFPIFAVITGSSTGLRGWPLFLARAAVAIAIATASYYVVEVPLRTGRLLRVDRRSGFGRAKPALAACMGFVLLLGVVQVTAGGSGAAAATRVVALPASAPSAAPVASAGVPPTRVLLVGDSTAFTLGFALSASAVEEAYDYTLVDEGVLGCGLVISAAVRGRGVVSPPDPGCSTNTPQAERWPARLARQVQQTHPDVVFVSAGRWEVLDRKATADGPWQNITQASDAAYVRAQLEQAVTISSASGAHVALATAPCFDSGEQPDGNPWPEDSAERVNAYNALVQQVAAARPGIVSVVPMNHVVCPEGRFQMQVEEVTVRAPDGIHYPYFTADHEDSADPDTVAQVASFGAWLAPQILPTLLGRTVASSG